MAILLEAKSLTKHYGQTIALESVDFMVQDSITGLLGPNGAGKSTGIKLFLGLLNPASGSANVLGEGLRERQRLAGGDAEHLLHQVDPGDQFGDRVLDLQARVHLQEEEAAVLAGDEQRAHDEIVASRAACGGAHLKVILEAGELGSYDRIRRASMLAMAAGADFVKTSTGKIPRASSLPIVLCMAEAVRDYADQVGTTVGIKAAGGIRTAKQAWQYLVVVGETLGEAWLTPDRFRIGASGLLNDVLLQLRRLDTGHYAGPDYVTVD